MRLRHPDGTVVHLAYCTNVHPAEDLDGVARPAAPLRRAACGPTLGVDRLGLGLWLPATAATELAARPRPPSPAADRARRPRPRGRDAQRASRTRGFHAQVVKLAVYHPDWSEPAAPGLHRRPAPACWRSCCPTTPRGAASRRCRWAGATPWDDDRQDAALRAARRARRGRCARSAADDRPHRSGSGWSPSRAASSRPASDAVERLGGRRRPRSLGVCLDTCHLAVGFEDAAGRRASGSPRPGLPVVKLQASAALHADDPADPATRAALATFVEGRFLHQIRELRGGGVPAATTCDAALDGPDALPGAGPWRVHFHVPLHAEPAAAAAHHPRRARARPATRWSAGSGAADRPRRGRDLHLVRCCRRGRPAARRRGPRRAASPASWLGARPRCSTSGLRRPR